MIPPVAVTLKLFALALKVAPLPLPVKATKPVGEPVNPYPPLIISQPRLPSGQLAIAPLPLTHLTFITTPCPLPPTVVNKSPTE